MNNQEPHAWDFFSHIVRKHKRKLSTVLSHTNAMDSVLEDIIDEADEGLLNTILDYPDLFYISENSPIGLCLVRKHNLTDKLFLKLIKSLESAWFAGKIGFQEYREIIQDSLHRGITVTDKNVIEELSKNKYLTEMILRNPATPRTKKIKLYKESLNRFKKKKIPVSYFVKNVLGPMLSLLKDEDVIQLINDHPGIGKQLIHEWHRVSADVSRHIWKQSMSAKPKEEILSFFITGREWPGDVIEEAWKILMTLDVRFEKTNHCKTFYQLKQTPTDILKEILAWLSQKECFRKNNARDIFRAFLLHKNCTKELACNILREMYRIYGEVTLDENYTLPQKTLLQIADIVIAAEKLAR